MKKIQLSDGMPSSIRRTEAKEKTRILTDEIRKLCEESGLSYVEINKALYLVDEELYIGILNQEEKRNHQNEDGMTTPLESIAKSLSILAEDTKASRELRIEQIKITDEMIEKITDLKDDPFGLNERD